MNIQRHILLISIIVSALLTNLFAQEEDRTRSYRAKQNQPVRYYQQQPVQQQRIIRRPQSVRTKASQKKASQNKLSPDLQKFNQLIQALIEEIGAIKQSCKSHEKFSEQEEQEHASQVKKARAVYEQLYQEHKKHAFLPTFEQNKSLKPALQKLFECTNIQNKPWPHQLFSEKNKN